MLAFLICLMALPSIALGKDYFTAATFEHKPRYTFDTELTPEEVKKINLNYYIRAVALAAEKKADIILFNEYGLSPYPELYPYLEARAKIKQFAEHVPDPSKKFNPCTEKAKDRHILYTISCLARENKIYIVVNLPDIQPCQTECSADGIDDCSKKCPQNGSYVYNTNVAFDSEGTIVARYHKMHPYFEVVDIPQDPEFSTFETDFGKFGMIICFDSVWEEATQLVRDHGIDTLLFPTFWFDDIVPFNAVEWQQSWAFANKVNFISANTQTAYEGSLGSGIFSKTKGALVYTYEPDSESKLLMASLPVKSNSEAPAETSLQVLTHDGVIDKVETGDKFPEHCFAGLVGQAKQMYKDYRCFKGKSENYSLVKIEQPSGVVKACNNGFCCTLSYSAERLEDDFYLAVFSGLDNVKNYYEFWEEVCLLVRCDPFQDKACFLQPSRSKTVFQNVELRAKFHSKHIYPTVSKNKFRLAPKSEWNYVYNSDEAVLRYQTDSREPLLKVGLMGRDYARDPPYAPYHDSLILKQPDVVSFSE